jgi:tellurite resistance protein TerC
MASATPQDWLVFGALVAILLVLDIAVVSRGRQSLRRAWIWSGIWIGVSLAFGAGVAWRFGSDAGLTYLTAYALEKSLSVDNLFLFAMVFSQTGIPPALQRRALIWGVVGALVMRAVLIGAGLALIERFQWVIYPFAALLLYGAWGMLGGHANRRGKVAEACTLCSSWVARLLPISPVPSGERFTVRKEGRLHATPLLVALILIETADLVFALDSIPAVLAVTRDPFLVYTSNVFALLGLRALYSVLGDLLDRLRFLRYGLAVMLMLVAVKLLAADAIHVPPSVSLAVIAAIFAISVAASRIFPGRGLPCEHLGGLKQPAPQTDGCAECLAQGDSWVELRLCLSCGHVGCCDSSKNKHATRHFQETQHPVIRSLQPGEKWKWCYVDKNRVG